MASPRIRRGSSELTEQCLESIGWQKSRPASKDTRVIHPLQEIEKHRRTTDGREGSPSSSSLGSGLLPQLTRGGTGSSGIHGATTAAGRLAARRRQANGAKDASSGGGAGRAPETLQERMERQMDAISAAHSSEESAARQKLAAENRPLLEKMDETEAVLRRRRTAREKKLMSLGVFSDEANALRARSQYRADLKRTMHNSLGLMSGRRGFYFDDSKIIEGSLGHKLLALIENIDAMDDSSIDREVANVAGAMTAAVGRSKERLVVPPQVAEKRKAETAARTAQVIAKYRQQVEARRKDLLRREGILRSEADKEEEERAEEGSLLGGEEDEGEEGEGEGQVDEHGNPRPWVKKAKVREWNEEKLKRTNWQSVEMIKAALTRVEQAVETISHVSEDMLVNPDELRAPKQPGVDRPWLLEDATTNTVVGNSSWSGTSSLASPTTAPMLGGAGGESLRRLDRSLSSRMRAGSSAGLYKDNSNGVLGSPSPGGSSPLGAKWPDTPGTMSALATSPKETVESPKRRGVRFGDIPETSSSGHASPDIPRGRLVEDVEPEPVMNAGPATTTVDDAALPRRRRGSVSRSMTIHGSYFIEEGGLGAPNRSASPSTAIQHALAGRDGKPRAESSVDNLETVVPALPALDLGPLSYAEQLQKRLERVWTLLRLPVMEKLDMVIKYTSLEMAPFLEPALEAWEGAAAAVLSRENALLLLGKSAATLQDEIDKEAAEAARSAHNIAMKVARISSHAQAKQVHAKNLATLAAVEAIVVERLSFLEGQFGDILRYNGSPYLQALANGDGLSSVTDQLKSLNFSWPDNALTSSRRSFSRR